jgi:4-hydroxythreonine-4-phosphate dehydrogenase
MSSDEYTRPVLGISIGDLNGIGPEVIIKTFSDPRMLQFCTPVIYGSMNALNYHRKAIDARAFNVTQVKDINEIHTRRLNLITCWQENPRIEFGQKSAESGHHAWLALKAMVEDAKWGKLDGMVTAPIDKHSIQNENFSFPGHTEYLMESFGMQDSLMFLIGEEFKIGVVTGHIPLSEVADAISSEKVLSKIRIMHESLITDFGIPNPKIAVLGLNPHAGESGLLGSEEEESITPAIEAARNEGILSMGPYPADGFFGTHMHHNFDGILAMYHDQGLVPFKLLHFEKGVNYTAGLPVVRTSPDHGTAYAIAGKNMANEQSFREAVYLACDVLRQKKAHEEMNRNPLQSQVSKEKEI